jgi:hypothetical protein
MSGRGASLHILPGRREPTVASGGGAPHDPDMEARLTRLESDFQAMRADLSATRADTAYIRGRLESLPSTWQMVGTIMAGNVGLAGILLAAVKLFGHP